MIEFKYFQKKIKDVSINDYLSVIPMTCALILKPLFAKRYRDSWVICEEKTEARDNGYHFFKYLCLNHQEQCCYYAIDKRCKDREKVRKLGKTVHYGSIKHWLLYFTGKYNISSQKGGKPNAALCSFFELNGLFKPHNVFLQHGVTKDKNDWLMAEKCRFDYFVTATTTEDRFVRQAFGYDPSIIHYTGFPRFDNLHDGIDGVKNRIIIMPTWRKWLRLKSEKNESLGPDLKTSVFIKGWGDLLNSEELSLIIDKYNLDIIFYPHRAMQPYISDFRENINPRIKIASIEDYDIQELMKSAQLMITDYSSVYFDMFYMKKPVIFYQFDEEEFRKYHYEKGWFDYYNNEFGNSHSDYHAVVTTLEEYINCEYKVSSSFLKAHEHEFELFDRMNSERIYRDLSRYLS